VDTMASERETSFRGKHRTEVTEATEEGIGVGGWERFILVEHVASLREGL
jgi:hypothetical protein